MGEPSTSFTLSLRSEKSMGLVHYDVVSFGLASELSELNLPTYGDILRYYFFLGERSKAESKMFSYKTLTPNIVDKLIYIWSKLNIAVIERNNVTKKLNAFLDKYYKEDKNRSKHNNAFAEFINSIKKIFFIGKCKCNLITTECSCGLIPPHLSEFMMDQHNDRKLTIPEFMEENIEVPTTIPTATGTNDPTYDPQLDVDMEMMDTAGVSEVPVEHAQRSYTQRYSAMRYAMMCDRFGISNRVASVLATNLFEDINYKDAKGNLVIMDKSKVAREKLKVREATLRKRNEPSTIIAFSFDGRKDESLSRELIEERYHTSIVKEPHLVVLSEPNSKFIGFVNLGNTETAVHKFEKLNEFFTAKGLSLDQLIGICSDGEPANTGVEGGVIRLFEKHMNRPLHWFICLLHFNELPFRHLFDALEKTATTGPRTATGKLYKQLQECEKLQVSYIILLPFNVILN